jgi:hypothetical protein
MEGGTCAVCQSTWLDYSNYKCFDIGPVDKVDYCTFGTISYPCSCISDCVTNVFEFKLHLQLV